MKRYGIVKMVSNRCQYKVMCNDGELLDITDPNIKFSGSIQRFQGARIIVNQTYAPNGKRRFSLQWPEGGRRSGEIIKIDREQIYIASKVRSANDAREILCCDRSELDFVPDLYTLVEYTPEAAKERQDYAHAKEVAPRKLRPVTEEISKQIYDLLSEHGSPGSIVSIRDAGDILIKHSITAKDFGFSSWNPFYESMSNYLRVRYSDDGKPDGIVLLPSNQSGQFALSQQIMSKLGYETPTILQCVAFRDPAFWESDCVLILGATSTGKTAIPLVKFIAQPKKGKLLIAVTMRALATQMQKRFLEKCAPFNFRVLISTSEDSTYDNDILSGNTDIAIVIYEKLYAFSAQHPNFLGRYDHMVFDEASIITDQERGMKCDFLLARAAETRGIKITILGTPYDDWSLYIRKYGMHKVCSISRPTPVNEFFMLPESIQSYSGKTRNIYGLNDCDGISIQIGRKTSFLKSLFSLCSNEYRIGHKVIVFTFSQQQTGKIARDIFRAMKENSVDSNRFITRSEEARQKEKDSLLAGGNMTSDEFSLFFDDEADCDMLCSGIAFHNASMPQHIRSAIEERFLNNKRGSDDGGLWLVVATDTIAYGLNSNVDTVILATMQKNDSSLVRNLSVNEYQNCIGRSGRLGYLDGGGTSYTFFPDSWEGEEHDKIAYYRNAQEKSEIRSSFNSMFRSGSWDQTVFYMLASVCTRSRFTLDDLQSVIQEMLLGDSPVQKESLLSFADMTLKGLLSLGFAHKSSQELTDDLYESKVPAYQVTALGKQLSGFVLSVSSYETIRSSIEACLTEDKLYYFDFFYALASTEDVLRYCSGIVRRVEEGGDMRLSREDQSEICELASFTLPLLEQAQAISPARKVLLMQLCSIAENPMVNLSAGDDAASLKIALYASLWIMGYNEDLIYRISGAANMVFPNIRRKFGEKFSYYIDLAYQYLCVISETVTDEHANDIKRLSIAMFYGVDVLMLKRRGICMVTPEAVNALHIASVCIRRYELSLKSDDAEGVVRLLRACKRLNSLTKRILQEEGIDCD